MPTFPDQKQENNWQSILKLKERQPQQNSSLEVFSGMCCCDCGSEQRQQNQGVLPLDQCYRHGKKTNTIATDKWGHSCASGENSDLRMRIEPTRIIRLAAKNAK